MIFIGDIHGRFAQYLQLRAQFSDTFQVGDFGFGFPDSMDVAVVPEDPHHRFIRGNHDNPEICRQHPNCLPDYGYFDDMQLFFVSGAFSIDKQYRIPGVSWWEDEELSMLMLTDVITRYKEIKPRYMVSHDCPKTAQIHMFPRSLSRNYPNVTKAALQEMYECHQPEIWVFGHWHEMKISDVGSTKFVSCGSFTDRPLDALSRECIFEIEEMTWND